MKLSYVFYSDAGHGWLAVPRAELVSLGIAAQVTTYSYQRGDTVYLEEDCDASLFIRAKQAAGEYPLKYKESTCPTKRSRIRGYDAYRATLKSTFQ
jgi:hypothetical protein